MTRAPTLTLLGTQPLEKLHTKPKITLHTNIKTTSYLDRGDKKLVGAILLSDGSPKHFLKCWTASAV